MYLFLVPFVLVVIPSICQGKHGCNVYPKDQVIEVGSSTEVVCQTSCIKGKIFWKLDEMHVDESLSSTINSTHSILSLRNFTYRSAPTAYHLLQCHSADTQQILGGTTIRTYSKPGKISCELQSENQERDSVPQLLTCKWEHQTEPALPVNYTVLFANSSHTPPREICISTDKTFTCKAKILMSNNFTVGVRAKTAAWAVDSDRYEFEPYSVWKMIRPKVTVTASSDHLLVDWKRSLHSKKCHCQVKYSKGSPPEEGNLEWVLDKTLNPGENGNIILDNVESCVTYHISVRCAAGVAPWSDWSLEKTVLTKLNQGHVELRLWRKVSQLGENGVRKVHTMWGDIPSTCQGTFNYMVKHMTGVNYTYTSCGNSTCAVDVNQDAHRLTLTVFHNELLLAEDSVYVPAIGESLPQVTDIQASTHDGIILVSWRAPVQPVSGYMIDWTHNGNQYYWRESKYTNATLFGLLDKKPYDITITPLFNDKTGHSAHALQICSGLGDPGNVAIISVQAYDKSAYVSWDEQSLDACSGAVSNYTVFYVKQEGPQLNVTVDSKRQDVCLKGLDPDTLYSIYVEATAPTGITTSGERLFKTKRFDPRLVTALTVCGSVTIFLVLSLGLCCAVQWKKFREKLVPNPGLSSVALWPPLSHDKAVCHSRPFRNPSESICDRVYTEETQPASLPSPATDWNTADDQAEEYADSAMVFAPDLEDEMPVEPVETQYPSPPGEITAFLPSESGPVSPYRSQTSAESPVSRGGKQCKRFPGKQQEKTTLKTIYVTLDMFEQGQGR